MGAAFAYNGTKTAFWGCFNRVYGDNPRQYSRVFAFINNHEWNKGPSLYVWEEGTAESMDSKGRIAPKKAKRVPSAG